MRISPFSAPRIPNCRFLANFLPIENPSKIGSLKKPPKISKIRPRSAQRSILKSFWHPFWHHFFIKFRKRRKLIFCNKYKLILLFSHLKASHFGTKFRSKSHMFFNTIFSRFVFVLASENDSKIEVFSHFFRRRRFFEN